MFLIYVLLINTDMKMVLIDGKMHTNTCDKGLGAVLQAETAVAIGVVCNDGVRATRLDATGPKRPRPDLGQPQNAPT